MNEKPLMGSHSSLLAKLDPPQLIRMVYSLRCVHCRGVGSLWKRGLLASGIVVAVPPLLSHPEHANQLPGE